MEIKDIFAKAEGGTLTYEQFMEAAGNSNFKDLSEGGYVSKQKYTDELSSRDTRITDLTATITSRDSDLESLRTQLQNAGTDNEKLTALSTQFADLQKQYDKDTKAYQKQLKDQAYKHAVNDFANQQNFTSQAAKRDFITTMLSKNLQVENDTIIGATDFVAAYTKENADAFKVTEPTPPADSGTKPHFTGSTSSSGNGGDNPSPFNFNFVGVRSKDK